MKRRLGILLLCGCVTATSTLMASPPGDFYWADSDYNVVCDGMNPDTADIQAALNAVAGTGGTLVLPAGGVCVYDDQLTLDGSNWIIEGNGATLLLDATATNGGLLVEDSSHFEIRNLTLDGTGATQGTSPHLLTLERSNDGLLLDVRAVESPADGFRLSSTGTEPAGGVRTNTIRMIACSSEGSHGNGLTLVEAADVSVLGGGFHDSGNGATDGSGIRIESETSDETVTDILIQGVSVSGSAGVGIELGRASGAEGSQVANVRIVDSDLTDDAGGALLLDAGTDLVVRGNQIHDSASADQAATVLVTENAGDVLLTNNSFRNLETGDPAIWVQSGSSGPGLVEIADNQLAAINVNTTANASSTAAVVHDSDEGIISGNDFSDIGFKGILTRGVRSVIAENTLNGMTENVILVNGADSLVLNNFIGSLATPATVTTAGQSVIRIREPDNVVRGNSMLCGNTTQRAIHFDEGAALVTNTTVRDCDAGNQGNGLHFAGAVTALALDNNVRY